MAALTEDADDLRARAEEERSCRAILAARHVLKARLERAEERHGLFARVSMRGGGALPGCGRCGNTNAVRKMATSAVGPLSFHPHLALVAASMLRFNALLRTEDMATAPCTGLRIVGAEAHNTSVLFAWTTAEPEQTTIIEAYSITKKTRKRLYVLPGRVDIVHASLSPHDTLLAFSYATHLPTDQGARTTTEYDTSVVTVCEKVQSILTLKRRSPNYRRTQFLGDESSLSLIHI